MSEKHTAAAKKLSESRVQAQWRVSLGDGRTYIVNTYPDSQTIYVQTTRFRPVNVGMHTAAELRAAIALATNQEQSA